MYVLLFFLNGAKIKLNNYYITLRCTCQSENTSKNENCAPKDYNTAVMKSLSRLVLRNSGLVNFFSDDI